MKKILFIIFCAIMIASLNCSKPESCRNKTVASEEGTITAYATANGMTVTRHTSGVFYQILAQGSGATPTLSSKVTVTYVGKLLDGTIFDQNTTGTQFNLSDLISAWQTGLQLIQKGGHIQLIVPSSLAYGCQGSGPIPGNSILFFDINLLDVQ